LIPVRSAVYLIDADSLIRSSRSYYRFKFAPSFWERLEEEIADEGIAILDLVKHEIERGDDELSKWIGALQIGHYIDRRNPEILLVYQAVLEHLRTNPCYKASALTQWASANAADPWLIAGAKVQGLTIVTFESSNANLNCINPSRTAKIPDVARVFDVTVCDLFSMMDDLNFRL